MSEIEWGEPIEVNGKRPEWLEDGTLCQIIDEGWDADEWLSEQVAEEWNWVDLVPRIRLPADHGYYSRCRRVAETTKATDDWQPCERTVRACIEALPESFGAGTLYADGVSDCHTALEALLPKPDPAEVLAGEWLEQSAWEDLGVRLAVEEYTRHLINTGRLRT